MFNTSLLEGTVDRMLGALGMALIVPLPVVGFWQNNFSGFQYYNQYNEVVGLDILQHLSLYCRVTS